MRNHSVCIIGLRLFCFSLVLIACLPNVQPIIPTPTMNGITPSPDFRTTIPSASLTPSVIPPSKTPVLRLTPTETLEPDKFFSLYVYRLGVGYQVVDFTLKPPLNMRFLDVVTSAPNAVSSPSTQGPGNAMFLAFSNFLDKIAYWSGLPGQLWISDPAYLTPKSIFVDSKQQYVVEHFPNPSGEIALSWTPDDQNLLVSVKADPNRNLIYHFQTDIIDEWPYQCDGIAPSPRSGRFAIWCSSKKSGQHQYAVLEWGGEIWYSNTAPSNEVVRSVDGLATISGWSSDGEQVAYFEPDDPTGYLTITSTQGLGLKTLPGGAYWLSEKQPLFLPPESPIQWSQNGAKLLVYGNGSESSPCPLWENIYEENNVSYHVPCWQVIDTATGKTIWTLSNSANELISSNTPSDIQSWSFYQASISPDGMFLALASKNAGLDQLSIVDLTTSKVLWAFDVSVGAMRWGKIP